MKWEYYDFYGSIPCADFLDHGYWLRELNELGQQGWEAVTAVFGQFSVKAILKRPMEE